MAMTKEQLRATYHTNGEYLICSGVVRLLLHDGGPSLALYNVIRDLEARNFVRHEGAVDARLRAVVYRIEEEEGRIVQVDPRDVDEVLVALRDLRDHPAAWQSKIFDREVEEGTGHWLPVLPKPRRVSAG